MNRADHTFERSFTSVADPYADIATVMISLLIARGFLEEDFKEWYYSGKMILPIKSSALDLPVLCENDKGGLK
jgi:hypothetical protein